MRLSNRKIVLGITGCIAAYKAAYLVRLLKKEGAQVKVVMTDSALKFITPLTMETLSENPVNTTLFPESGYYSTHHISLAEWADLILIAPATGNIIGKIAGGIADDLLSTTVMAAQSPVMISPAMNTHMYNNPIVQENIARLKRLGYEIVEPGVGEMACHTVGVGRLPEPDEILEIVVSHFNQTSDLTGMNVLVTAGPTVEHLDPVRYISNPSSGKMGYAIAQRAIDRGAKVTLISGPVSIPPPSGVNLVSVKSGREMYEKTNMHFPDADILFMVAAVSDYLPENTSDHKIKKSSEPISLKLNPQIDILKTLADYRENQVMVGFSMETDNDPAKAKDKLHRKKLDMIVLNNLYDEGAGFGADTNKITIIDREDSTDDLPVMSKILLADKIIDHALKFVKKD